MPITYIILSCINLLILVLSIKFIEKKKKTKERGKLNQFTFFNGKFNNMDIYYYLLSCNSKQNHLIILQIDNIGNGSYFELKCLVTNGI